MGLATKQRVPMDRSGQPNMLRRWGEWEGLKHYIKREQNVTCVPSTARRPPVWGSTGVKGAEDNNLTQAHPRKWRVRRVVGDLVLRILGAEMCNTRPSKAPDKRGCCVTRAIGVMF